MGKLLIIPISLLAFISGAAALIYETVWAFQFTAVLGNSIYSASIVLCAFLTGLGMGGWYIGRFTDRHKDPFLLYAIVEGVIAFIALMVPLMVSILSTGLPSLYPFIGDSVLLLSLLRFFFAFLIIFLPCFFIGGTLPLLCRIAVRVVRDVGKTVGLIYGFNVFGAVIGVLGAGFFLIQTVGLFKTNLLAVVLNILVMVLSLLLRHYCLTISSNEDVTGFEFKDETREIPKNDGAAEKVVLLMLFISGFASLSLEVLWIRYVLLASYSYQYSFTIVLATFLAGVAIGSFLYEYFLSNSEAKGKLLVIVSFISSSTIILLLLLTTVIINNDMFPHFFGMEAIEICFFMVLLPAITVGLIFPLACSLISKDKSLIGSDVGKVYAVNITGCIFGAISPVLIFLPTFGLQLSFSIVAFVIITGGAIAWRIFYGNRYPYRLLASIIFSLILLIGFGSKYKMDVARDLFKATYAFNFKEVFSDINDIIFFEEGRAGTAVVIENKINKDRTLYVNSIQEASSLYGHALNFKLMGHLGPLLHPKPENVLMIAFGAGIASGSVIVNPEVKKLTVVELEPRVIDGARYMRHLNNDLHSSEKLEIVVEDGRNHLARTGDNYSVIISDSTHPRSADSWVLYTKEFYELVKKRLDSDGIFVQWIPFHSISKVEYSMIVKSLESVFPSTTLWRTVGNDQLGGTHSYSLLVASKKHITIDLKRLRKKLSDPILKAELSPWDLSSAEDILDTFGCGGRVLARMISPVPLMTDDLPYVQFFTKYSDGPSMSHSTCSSSIWPYLVNYGEEKDRVLLENELSKRRLANELLYAGNISGAYKIYPDWGRIKTWSSNIDKAKSYWTTLLIKYPGDSDKLKKFFKTPIFRSEDFIDVLEDVIRGRPSFAEVRYRLGIVLMYSGRYGEAYMRYGEAIGLYENEKNYEMVNRVKKSMDIILGYKGLSHKK